MAATETAGTDENGGAAWERPRLCSLSAGLARAARTTPDKPAIHYRIWHGSGKSLRIDAWQSVSYGEFWKRIGVIAHGLTLSGVTKGDVCLVMWLPPSQMDALALMFALFLKGAVIMWLDPRTMTFEQLLSNIEKVGPRVMIAGTIVKTLFRAIQTLKRRVLCIKVVVGPRLLKLRDAPALSMDVPVEEANEDGGLIVFTTGSTGPPKAVRLTHRCFAAQLDAYQALASGLDLGKPGELVACHSALNFNAFDLALGNTTITLPDPANPRNIRPEFLMDIDSRFKAVMLTGSRVVFENLADYCERHQPQGFLSSLRLGFAGGAPVSPLLHQRVCRSIPSLKELYSAYGATEGLPLAIAGSHSTWDRPDFKKRSTETGDGIALGQVCPHVVFRVMKRDAARLVDERAKSSLEIGEWQEDWEAEAGEVGELVVDSPSVSHSYVGDKLATAATKIKRGDCVMHRTGDLVSRDPDGALWMVGRASQAVALRDGSLVHPVCVESLFEGFAGLRRCALVGPKRGEEPVPTLVVLIGPGFDAEAAQQRLRASRWGHVKFDIVVYTGGREFPMDARHNSKIRREILQAWVQQQR